MPLANGFDRGTTDCEVLELGHPTKGRVKAPTKRRPSKDFLNTQRRESILKTADMFPECRQNSEAPELAVKTSTTKSQEIGCKKLPPPVPQKPSRLKSSTSDKTVNDEEDVKDMQLASNFSKTRPQENNVLYRRTNSAEPKLPFSVQEDESTSNFSQQQNSNGRFKPTSFSERLKASSLSSSVDFTRKNSPGSSLSARLGASNIVPARRGNKQSLSGGSLSSTWSNSGSKSLDYLPKSEGSRLTSNSLAKQMTQSLYNSDRQRVPQNDTEKRGINSESDGDVKQLVNTSILHHSDRKQGKGDDDLSVVTSCKQAPLTSDGKLNQPEIPKNLSLPALTSLNALSNDSLSESLMSTNFSTDGSLINFPNRSPPFHALNDLHSESAMKLPDPPLANLTFNMESTSFGITDDFHIAKENTTKIQDDELCLQTKHKEAQEYGSRLTVKKWQPTQRMSAEAEELLRLPVIPPLESPGREFTDDEITREFQVVPPPPPSTFETGTEDIVDVGDIIDPPTLYVDSSSHDDSDVDSNFGLSDSEFDIKESNESNITVVSNPQVLCKQSESRKEDPVGTDSTDTSMWSDIDQNFSNFTASNMVISEDVNENYITESSSTPLVLHDSTSEVLGMEKDDENNSTDKVSSLIPTKKDDCNDSDIDLTTVSQFQSKDISSNSVAIESEGISSQFNDSDSEMDDYSAQGTGDQFMSDSYKSSTFPGQWSSFSSNSSIEFSEKGIKVNLRKMLKKQNNTSEFDSENEDQDHHELTFTKLSARQSHGATEDEDNCEVIEDKLNHYPVEEWTTSDVGDWLEITGVGGLRETFKRREIDGKKLLEIDLQLLDEMAITDPDDRELILSEIYSLKNPDEGELEISLLDALDNTSGIEHEKMLALLEALKSPASQGFMQCYLPSSPSPCESPRDNEDTPKPTRPVEAKAATIESRAVRQKERSPSEESTDVEVPVRRVPRPVSVIGISGTHKELQMADRQIPLDFREDVKDEDKKNKKASKRRKFLPDAFSFRRGKGSKLAKIFKSSKLSDPSLKAFLQSGAQGIVTIFSTGIEGYADHISLLVTMNTTTQDIVRALCERIEVAADERVYYLAQCQTDGSKLVPDVELKSTDCPLVLQCRWPDVNRYKFELRKRAGGRIKVICKNRSVYFDIVAATTATDVIQLAVSRHWNGEASEDYHLVFLDAQGYEPRMSPDLTLLSMPHDEGTCLSFRMLKDSEDVVTPQLPAQAIECVETKELRDRIDQLEKEAKSLQNSLEVEKNTADSEKMNSEALGDRNVFLEEMVKAKEEEAEKLKEEAEEQRVSASRDRQKLNEVILEKKKLRTLFDELNEKAEELEDENEKMKRDSSHWKKIAVSQDKLMQDIEPVKAENEEYRSRIKELEARVSQLEEEALLAGEEKSTAAEDLKTQINILQQANLDKDSKLLEVEFAFQRKEREVFEANERNEDLRRNVEKSSAHIQDAEERVKDLSKKIESYKRLVSEKDKQIQAFKLTHGKFEEASREESSQAKLQLLEKEDLIEKLKKQLEKQQLESKDRIATLQEIISEKDVAVRQTEMNLAKENEDLKLSTDLLERKVTVRDQTIKKLEDKVSKLESMTRDNLKKFEKFMSDKDRMMKQVKLDAEKDIESLKNRLLNAEDAINQKDKQIRDLQKSSVSAKHDRNDLRIRRMEEENKQHKFLLEKLLGIVHSHDPRILKEFEDSFDEQDSTGDKQPLIHKEDEWC